MISVLYLLYKLHRHFFSICLKNRIDKQKLVNNFVKKADIYKKLSLISDKHINLNLDI